MVAGDAVNTAARVQAVPTPGTVWVDQATRELTAAAIAFTTWASTQLKGKAEPLAALTGGRVVAALGGAQRVDGLEAPLVGRDRRCGWSRSSSTPPRSRRSARLARRPRRPRGRQVAAGLGVREVRRRTHRRHLMAPRALPVLRRGRRVLGLRRDGAARLGLREGESGHEVERAGSRLLGTVATSRRRGAPGCGPGSPRCSRLPVAPAFERTDLFAAWTTFLERVSGRRRPLVLLVRGHAARRRPVSWTSSSTCCRQCSGSRSSWSCSTRPELARATTSARGRVDGASPCDLEPLPDAAMGALVDGLVDDLPAQRSSGARSSAAEGIPLYAVETVRSLIDRDAVVSPGGPLRLRRPRPPAGGPRPAAAPRRACRPWSSARLDALTPAERRAVPGRQRPRAGFRHRGRAGGHCRSSRTSRSTPRSRAWSARAS